MMGPEIGYVELGTPNLFKGRGILGPKTPPEGETEESLVTEAPLGVSGFIDTEFNGFIGLNGPVRIVGIDGGIIGTIGA